MAWETQLDKWAAEYLPDLKVAHDEPMSRHTSFRVGGPAKRMAFPSSGEQVVLLLDYARACGARPLVIGNGTNLLAPDAGLDRLVIDTSAGLNRLEKGDEPEVLTAEAGVSLARLADFACKQGLAGLEFAHGIPGTVGGAVCMNAGAYGGEIAQVIVSACVLTPEGVRTVSKEELSLGYRSSVVMQNGWVVLEATFELPPGSPDEIKATMADLAARRREKQPLQYPSCGSFFKRPVGYYAGALIEQAGLKGYRVGDAQVSEMHAGFVINRGHATSSEIYRLMQEVQCRVQAQFGVTLEPEVRLIGHFEA